MTAIAFVIGAWNPQVWLQAMRIAAPGRDVRLWPDLGDLRSISYAAAWLPPPDALKSMPNLQVLFSLGAGVDAILADKTLPGGIPIVRVNDPDLTNRMSEYVVMHCLMHHRQQRRLDDQQQRGEWNSFHQHAASAMTVGVMGLGVLGRDAALKLKSIGFNVVGWSRTPKTLQGMECFAGAGGLDDFLSHTDILVCLLPATAETEGIINYNLLSKLSRKGPLGAPVLINAGRGRQQVEDDILRALDQGVLHAATLDVFRTEPLPQESPLWSHPRISISPHSAADSDPATICRYVERQISRFERGESLQNVVDRQRGY